MIDGIRLYFGSSENAEPLEFQPGPITVFVGPNNSGKSLILREIEKSIWESGSKSIPVMIDAIELAPIPREDILQVVFGSGKRLSPDDVPENYKISVKIGNSFSPTHTSASINIKGLYSGFSDVGYNGGSKALFLYSLTIRLDGKNRLSLTDPQESGDLLAKPSNHLMALFVDQAAREQIRNITADAFGLYFVIDPTHIQKLRVRMSSRPPEDPSEEQALDPRSREFHRHAVAIEELSDGVKAFTGLTAAVFSGNFRVMLIDEPEAFLHPPLARKLGKVLTQTAATRKANVFASTHSPEFLMGCIQSGKPVNVVRLTYQPGKATARLLPSADLEQMMRDPLLRSTGVLNALFHPGAVICEGDIDRAFYEEVNARLVNTDEGLNDVMFTNAVGKQTIHKIIGPLRKMGISTAAIVDLDIIKKGDLSALLRSANVPEALVDTWSTLKKHVLDKFTELNIDPKNHSIDTLDKDSKVVAKNLIANAAEYGVFIVPVGAVEGWLSHLGATGTRTNWIISLFELMGTDPASSQFVGPDKGDVWDFIREISNWIRNPEKKGMPD